MTPRYSLRFESGERQGESIPIPGNSFSVGRRPGNSLQISDPSVSGKHAELLVDASGIRLRDLGSTNGTRVDGERTQEASLAPGSRLCFGNVEFTLIDANFAVRPAPSVTQSAREELGEAAGSVSAEDLQRARKGSRLMLYLAPVLVAAVGCAWWFSRNQGSSTGGGRAITPVQPLAGNLLAEGYSFEGDVGWPAPEGAPQAFSARAGSRLSGEQGLGAELVSNEWAGSLSPSVAVESGRSYQVSASVRLRGAVSAALALELAPAAERETELHGRPKVWSQRLTSGEEFQQITLRVHVPQGYRRVRVMLEGRTTAEGGGSVDFDDVSLLPSDAAGRELGLGLYTFALLGEPAQTGLVQRASQILLSELEYRRAGSDEACALVWTEEAQGVRLALEPGSRLLGRLEPTALRAGCATLGLDGYSARAADFSTGGVQTLLVGRDLELFGLRCEPPLAVSGRVQAGSLLLSLEANESASVLVQADFQAERSRAMELMRAAEAAEREGRIGACLAHLGELLARYPVQSEQVAKAEATRSRLTREGLEAVDRLRKDFERARFFRLLDLFQGLREQSQELQNRYAGSDVLNEVQTLDAAIETEVLALRARLDIHERQRLSAILAGLQAPEQGRLRQLIETYLTTHYPPAQGSAGESH